MSLPQEERIYREIQKKLLKQVDTVDQNFLKTKVDLLRESRPLQFLKRQSKSLKVISSRQQSPSSQKRLKLPSFEQQTNEYSSLATMYRTMQFEHNWGGMPIKPSCWGSNSSHLRQLKKQFDRAPSTQIKKLEVPKFTMDRSSILNKNSLFLVPFLKNKIKVINSDLNVAYVGDIPISYKYPPPPSRAPSQSNHNRRKFNSIAVPLVQPRRRISLDSIKGDIGPW